MHSHPISRKLTFFQVILRCNKHYIWPAHNVDTPFKVPPGSTSLYRSRFSVQIQIMLQNMQCKCEFQVMKHNSKGTGQIHIHSACIDTTISTKMLVFFQVCCTQVEPSIHVLISTTRGSRRLKLLCKALQASPSPPHATLSRRCIGAMY